jgi:hypothetical protein
MKQPLFFAKHSEMLSIGFDIDDNSLALPAADCDNEIKLTEELKRIGLKEPAPESDRDLVVNYNKKISIDPIVPHLIGAILSGWGYKCRVL